VLRKVRILDSISYEIFVIELSGRDLSDNSNRTIEFERVRNIENRKFFKREEPLTLDFKGNLGFLSINIGVSFN